MGNYSGKRRGGATLEEEKEEEALAEEPALLPLSVLPFDVFRDEILTRISPTDRAMLARVDTRTRAAVVEASEKLPRAGVSAELPLRLRDFVTGSVEKFFWAVSHDGRG
jgi:hypothetical protein